MIKIKSPGEIKILSEGGKITADVLHEVFKEVQPGVTTKYLDRLAERKILAAGGRPAFKGYKGFPATVCANINAGIVHGIPNDRRLQDGDLLSLDLGVYYKGLITDTAWTVLVGGSSFKDQSVIESRKRFLFAGRKALGEALTACRSGGRIGDISAAIQGNIESAGYWVIRDLVGHGVGHDLHEDPQVPGFGRRGQGIKLEDGLVLAVEVIYAVGRTEIMEKSDGWTIETKDRSLSGLFEETVAIIESGPIVLTKIDDLW